VANIKLLRAGFEIANGIAKINHATRRPKMAGVAGLEPVTSAVTGQRSNQLSYTPTEGEQEGKKTFRNSQPPNWQF
jgi:hypothetical protein